jgi:hypothetical protein
VNLFTSQDEIATSVYGSQQSLRSHYLTARH